MRRPFLALLGAVALGAAACAELRQPPPPPPPAGLLLGAAALDPAPVRAVAQAVAAAFADRGAGLAGRPAETAQAAAQLEFLASDLARDPRYGRIAEGVSRELALARQELRELLGIAPAAAPAVVTQALLVAARALRAGDQAAAAAALPAPTFEPGGAGSVARLGQAGPMPQAGIATQYAAEAIARADAIGVSGAPRFSETSFGFGAATTDAGARPGAGY